MVLLVEHMLRPVLQYPWQCRPDCHRSTYPNHHATYLYPYVSDSYYFVWCFHGAGALASLDLNYPSRANTGY